MRLSALTSLLSTQNTGIEFKPKQREKNIEIKERKSADGDYERFMNEIYDLKEKNCNKIEFFDFFSEFFSIFKSSKN